MLSNEHLFSHFLRSSALSQWLILLIPLILFTIGMAVPLYVSMSVWIQWLITALEAVHWMHSHRNHRQHYSSIALVIEPKSRTNCDPISYCLPQKDALIPLVMLSKAQHNYYSVIIFLRSVYYIWVWVYCTVLRDRWELLSILREDTIAL